VWLAVVRSGRDGVPTRMNDDYKRAFVVVLNDDQGHVLKHGPRSFNINRTAACGKARCAVKAKCRVGGAAARSARSVWTRVTVRLLLETGLGLKRVRWRLMLKTRKMVSYAWSP